MDNTASDDTRTVEDVFRDFKSRRVGLIKALSNDVEDFYQQCDPGIMLQFLRSRAFESYKEALEKAIVNGEEVFDASIHCTESVMSQFDEDCADVIGPLANLDLSEVRDKLVRHDIGPYTAHEAYRNKWVPPTWIVAASSRLKKLMS